MTTTLYIGSQFDDFRQYLDNFQLLSLYQYDKQIRTDLAGSLTFQKISTAQMVFGTSGDTVIVNGAGLSVPLGAVLGGSAASQSLNLAGGTVQEIQLWQGGSELLDATLSATQYSLSYAGNQLTIAGSGLPTDAASVAGLLAGTYAGPDIAVSSLTLASGGKTVSLSLSPTVFTLTAGDYKAVFTGSGLSTSVSGADLETLFQGGSLGDLGGSVTGVAITQLSTGATVLSESGIAPISLDQIADWTGYLESGSLASVSSVQLSAADLPDLIDALNVTAKAGVLKSISLIDSGAPTFDLTGPQARDTAALALISSPYKMIVTGASVAQAETMSHQHLASYSIATDSFYFTVDPGLVDDADSGTLTGITLLDGGIPNLSISPDQVTDGAPLFNLIQGDFTVTITAPSNATATIAGLAGHGSTVKISDVASNAAFTTTGDGTSFTVTDKTGTYHISAVSAVSFYDYTAIIAQTPGNGTVTTGNLTELYGAVFGREPDVAGLAYYQAELAANPSIPLTTFALNFLASPEYTGNSAHNYAQTPDGDAQFITASYNNLLHRAPEAGAVAWYQANVLGPILTGATPGTAAYTQAEALAHAQMLVDFSASAEFLADVQITATHPLGSQHWLLLV